jgi:hypothetical protein
MNLNVGKPVTGEELIGREREVSEIIRTLKTGQSVALIAPRRFGKTSIMMEVLSRLSTDKYYTGEIDFFTVPDIERRAFEITGQVLRNKKLDESLNKLKQNLEEILTNIQFRKEIEGAEFILSFGKPQKDPWEQLSSAVRFIDTFAIKHKKKICFAFDEFGDIEKLDGTGIIKLFRGIIQNQKQSVFIFSGSYESVMNKLFISSKAPFYRMVKIIQPGFIEKSSVLKFLKTKFETLKIPFNENEIIKGIEFTCGHPYYIRLFIQEYYFKYLQDKQSPELDDIFENMLISENSYLEKLWDENSKKRETKLMLIRIIETGKPYSGTEIKGVNISRAVKELAGKGTVFLDRASYHVSDPLFGIYIRKKILKLKG